MAERDGRAGPPRRRLRELDDRREVAQATGLSVAAVKSRLHRARAAVKARLGAAA